LNPLPLRYRLRTITVTAHKAKPSEHILFETVMLLTHLSS
jgi:hypothetical protein